MNEKDERREISPLHDLVIAKVFENMNGAPAAQSLINAVLLDVGRKPIDKILSLNCQETKLGDNMWNRACRLDVFAEAQGHKVNIEVQRDYYPMMIERSLYYAGLIISGSLGRGEYYDKIPHVTLINLLEGKPLRPKAPDFHQPVALMYTKGVPEIASNALFFHNVELQKFRKLSRKANFDKDNTLHRWLYFLCEGYKQPDAQVVKEVLDMDAGLQEFAERYEQSINDPALWAKYVHQRVAETDEEYFKKLALEESKKEGREEGRKEGRKEIARNALRMGMSVKQVVQMTSLTQEQVKEIAQESGLEIKAAKPKGLKRHRDQGR